MPEVSFGWVNGGSPFEIPGLPIAGHKEIREMQKKHTKAITEYGLLQFGVRCMTILSTKRVLDLEGPAKAHDFWNRSVVPMFVGRVADDLVWPVDEFTNLFNAWLDKEVYQKLGAKDYDDAVKKTKELLEQHDPKQLNEIISDINYDSLVIELYWRLRQRFKVIDVYGTEKPLTKESLAEVVTFPEDAVRFNKARMGEGDEPTFRRPDESVENGGVPAGQPASGP